MPADPAAGATAGTIAIFNKNLKRYTDYRLAHAALKAAILVAIGPTHYDHLDSTHVDGISAVTIIDILTYFHNEYNDLTPASHKLLKASLTFPFTSISNLKVDSNRLR